MHKVSHPVENNGSLFRIRDEVFQVIEPGPNLVVANDPIKQCEPRRPSVEEAPAVLVDKPRGAREIRVSVANRFSCSLEIADGGIGSRSPRRELRKFQLECLKVVPLKVGRFQIDELFKRFNICVAILPFIRVSPEDMLRTLLLAQASFDSAFDCLVDLA